MKSTIHSSTMAGFSEITGHFQPCKPATHSGTCTANSIATTTGATSHPFPATKTTEATQNNDSITSKMPTKTKWPPWPGTTTEPPSANLQATYTPPPPPQPPPPPHPPPPWPGTAIDPPSANYQLLTKITFLQPTHVLPPSLLPPPPFTHLH